MEFAMTFSLILVSTILIIAIVELQTEDEDEL